MTQNLFYATACVVCVGADDQWFGHHASKRQSLLLASNSISFAYCVIKLRLLFLLWSRFKVVGADSESEYDVACYDMNINTCLVGADGACASSCKSSTPFCYEPDFVQSARFNIKHTC